VPGKENLGQVYEQLEQRAAAENWTPMRLQRAKDQASRKLDEKDRVVQINQREADKQADTIVTQMGKDFTDITQIPIEVRNGMSSETLNNLTRVATSNKEASEQIKPNGETFQRLYGMMQGSPEEFMQLNLSEHWDQLTPNEQTTLLGAQQSMVRAQADEAKANEAARTGAASAAADKEAARRSGLKANLFGGSYTYVGKMTAGRKDIDDADKRAIADAMQPALIKAIDNDGIITDEEWRDAYGWATRSVTTTRKNMFGVTQEGKRPIYDMTIDMVADDDKVRIRRRLKASGAPSDDEAVLDYYRKFKGVKGAWQ
jgi:hypothetical protein